MDKIKLDPILLGAVNVFLQYGYRKTSLDDIAMAVGVSRQTLYQRYKNKETLFKMAVDNVFAYSIEECERVVKDNELPFAEKLLMIFHIWCGQHVSILKRSPQAAEILAEIEAVASENIGQKKNELEHIVMKVISSEELTIFDAVDPVLVAETLYHAAKGIMKNSETADEFKQKMAIAIRVICR